MSTAPSAKSRTCPACEAANAAPASRCWLCHEPLAGVSLAEPTLIPRPGVKRSGDRGMRIWCILLVVLVLVCIGLAGAAPGLAIGLAILGTPVMLRTLITIQRRERQGQPMIGGQVVGTLFVSLGLVVMMGVAAAVAYFATCWATWKGLADLGVKHGPHFENLDTFIYLSNGAGVVIGILAAIAVYRDHRRKLQARGD